MSGKQIEYIFQGFEWGEFLYHPEEPPQEILDRLDKAVKNVLFSGLKDLSINECRLAQEK